MVCGASDRVQPTGCSKVAWPVASVKVVHAVGAARTGTEADAPGAEGVGGCVADGVPVVAAVGVAVGVAVAGDGAATVPAGAGDGAETRAPRLVVTSTPAVTAAAVSVSTPASRARLRLRWSKFSTLADRLSLNTGPSLSAWRRAASASGPAGSRRTGSAPEIRLWIGSMSCPHLLCHRPGGNRHLLAKGGPGTVQPDLCR